MEKKIIYLNNPHLVHSWPFQLKAYTLQCWIEQLVQIELTPLVCEKSTLQIELMALVCDFSQSCIKFKKFNSSSVHGIELSSQLKFSSFDKNWTWTAAQLTIELFWTEFKVNSERVECPLVEKRRNWAFSMSWHTKFCSSFPFLVGGTPLSLNWLWTQFKKVQWWVEQQFKFSFWSMNWIWIDHQVQGKNWIELRTSIQFWTAIQLWFHLNRRLTLVNLWTSQKVRYKQTGRPKMAKTASPTLLSSFSHHQAIVPNFLPRP